MSEWYKLHRPNDFDEIIGQQAAVKSLVATIEKGKLPHVICLHGASGSGKTTVGRILRMKLGCGDSDFFEIDAATNRGIDDVKEIRSRLSLSPVKGKCRVWMIDESHRLTPEAQDAFLKTLEDTPKHVYFILATTEPEKLKPTVRSRCLMVGFKPLSKGDVKELIYRVAKVEKFKLDNEVAGNIIESAGGNARQALVLLEKASALDSVEEQVAAVALANESAQVKDLCRALLDTRNNWATVATILKNLDEDPERVRWAVLGYMRTVLLGGGKMMTRAARIINCFSSNYFDTKNTGLAMSAFDVMHAK